MNIAENSDKLHLHQNVLLELLLELDRVCKKHNIKYSLFAGTMLGAVRHQGFIPWDDDADVIMPRADYEKFLQVAKNEIDTEKYFLQAEFSEHFPMFFSKLRKNNTACIEKYRPRDLESHRGVFIDIFPCDNLSDNRLKRKLQFVFSKTVIAKSLFQRGYLTDSIVKKIFMLFCTLLPKKLVHSFVINKKEKSSELVHIFFGASKSYDKSVFSRKLFENTKDCIFERQTFKIFENSDGILKQLYGDYMSLPPENERKCKVHAQIVDLENSYEKYNDVHKKLKVDTYTRSIR